MSVNLEGYTLFAGEKKSRVYWYVLVCTGMYSCALVCTRVYSSVTRMLLVCYSYVLVCYSHITRMYSCGVLVTIACAVCGARAVLDARAKCGARTECANVFAY